LPESDSALLNAQTASTERIAVVGLGNILMGDDGVGVLATEALQREALPDNVEVFDAGTALQDLMQELAGFARVIFVDSCKAGGEPGAVYRNVHQPDAWDADAMGDSLHDMNVAQVLRLHRVAGGELGEVVLIGIEPADIALREGLSPELERRLPAILQSIHNELVIPLEQERPGGAT